jgi:hypothetical protein
VSVVGRQARRAGGGGFWTDPDYAPSRRSRTRVEARSPNALSRASQQIGEVVETS